MTCTVALTEVQGGVIIATMRLGGGLFTTVVYGGEHDQEREYACDPAEAEAVHSLVVERCLPRPVAYPWKQDCD